MKIEFFYFLVCMQIPRLFFQWNDKPLGKRKKFIYQIISSALIEVLLLLPLISFNNLTIFAIFLTVFHSLQLIKVENQKYILKRLIEFLFLFIVASFLFGIYSDIFTFNDFAKTGTYFLIENNVLFFPTTSVKSIKTLIVCLFGIITLVNEINNVIRFILSLIKTEPLNRQKKVDNEELYRGKIIGVIERVLFFFFVITNNYGSIAFILAAKGFTRYKELDDKNFAEYVLIGTLLSSALSIFWAVYINHIIKTM